MAQVTIVLAIPTRTTYLLDTPEKLKRYLQRKLKPIKIIEIRT